MKRPYLLPLIAFCTLVILTIWSLWDGPPKKKQDLVVRHIHIKLPPEEIKSRFQTEYEKACSDMQYKNYNQVKRYCLNVLKDSPNRNVIAGDLSFKVGPAALNMLAEVYLAEKKYTAAMTSFQRMIDRYRDESFRTYQDGEESWEGRAGAAGMLGQIRILTEVNHDLPQANIVWVRLMEAYQGQYPKRWQWKESYDSAGARWIIKYLEHSHASISQWENELQSMMNKTTDPELRFDLEITLARKYATHKMVDQAANLYHKIIAEHETEYWTSVEDGCFFYGMEAYKELIDFYHINGRKEMVAEEKLKMKGLYEKLLSYVKVKQIEYGADALVGYKHYFQPGE